MGSKSGRTRVCGAPGREMGSDSGRTWDGVLCGWGDGGSTARFRRNKFRLHPSHRCRGGPLPLTRPRVATPGRTTPIPPLKQLHHMDRVTEKAR